MTQARTNERRGLLANGNYWRVATLIALAGGAGGGTSILTQGITHAEFMDHTQAAGHPVLIERVDNIEERVASEILRVHERLDKMEARWDKFEERIYDAIDSH